MLDYLHWQLAHTRKTADANILVDTTASTEVITPSTANHQIYIQKIALSLTTHFAAEVSFQAAAADDSYSDLVLADGASAYWKLDELSGTNAVDSAGALDGTYVNTPTLGVQGVLGDGTTAVTFASASAERVDVADNVLLRPVAFSLELWFRQVTSDADFEILVSKTVASWANGYGMYTQGGSVHWFVNHYNNSDVIAAFTYGRWNHVVGTFDGDTARLYLNGVEVGTPVTGITLTHTTEPFYIASEQALSASYYYNGSEDEVAFYPSVLTATQVAAHFAARGRMVVAHTDAAAAAYVQSVVVWDFGATGTPLPVGASLNILVSAAGVVGIAHIEAYEKLGEVVAN